LQCDAVWCSVMQCDANWCKLMQFDIVAQYPSNQSIFACIHDRVWTRSCIPAKKSRSSRHTYRMCHAHVRTFLAHVRICHAHVWTWHTRIRMCVCIQHIYKYIFICINMYLYIYIYIDIYMQVSRTRANVSHTHTNVSHIRTNVSRTRMNENCVVGESFVRTCIFHTPKR